MQKLARKYLYLHLHRHILLTDSSRGRDGDCDGILHHDVRRGVDVLCISGYV